MTCAYCGQPPHPGEPVVLNHPGARAWMHMDCYLKRQMARRPEAVRARLAEILGAQVVLH